ncbi:hypothetical protein [Flagellimonas halotolerans]|uniref:Uncharacterized protein n=1 Tax=Flagellimonas halotolerans TaxID=3112164 RepID=A0ABU6IPN7_9FLAO|nr:MULTISPECIES: hypothetical protein [unclassified Allomuricauda]MEC3965073.1 hypothetical protein [Muricauda sp. SYSU M86414]MEC4265082.1 hypothetical protein [Muricauda sp. SYSU M84420]
MGKEDSEGAEVMKFKKGEGEMLTVIHTHVLSISSIFFLLGGPVWVCSGAFRNLMTITYEGPAGQVLRQCIFPNRLLQVR